MPLKKALPRKDNYKRNVIKTRLMRSSENTAQCLKNSLTTLWILIEIILIDRRI